MDSLGLIFTIVSSMLTFSQLIATQLHSYWSLPGKMMNASNQPAINSVADLLEESNGEHDQEEEEER